MSISLLKHKTEIYSDLLKTMSVSPVSGDLSRLINEEAVKDSIKNLLLTDRGERLFQPQIGSDIRKVLFENVSPDAIITVKSMVRETIEAFEPRCSLIEVDVIGSLDSNLINIVVMFNVVNRPDPVSLTVTLTRIR